jgi:hypothetical protein
VATDLDRARRDLTRACDGGDTAACGVTSTLSDRYETGKAMETLRSEVRLLPPGCPAGMTFIAGAAFDLSDGSGSEYAANFRKVTVSGFCLDRQEVTARSFAATAAIGLFSYRTTEQQLEEQVDRSLVEVTRRLAERPEPPPVGIDDRDDRAGAYA